MGRWWADAAASVHQPPRVQLTLTKEGNGSEQRDVCLGDWLLRQQAGLSTGLTSVAVMPAQAPAASRRCTDRLPSSSWNSFLKTS